MAVNLVIAIGGTGAKGLEAFLHLCAAGMGPRTAKVAFVEPDISNGNLTRSVALLSLYRSVYRRLHEQGRCQVSDDSTLFRTAIDIPEHGEVWSPVPDGVKNIHDLFQYQLMDRREALLFNSLFSYGSAGASAESEQQMALDEGFRGRPSVGSAVLTARAHKADRFWEELLELGKQVDAGETVRIFLIGSIFGGTGASGFPTLPRLIRKRLADAGVAAASVQMGGALMLPYFGFPPPKSSDTQIAAMSDRFLEMTQGALLYYHHLLRKNPNIFDHLYLIGWPTLVMLRQSEMGGPRQVNPPLLPELYAGLAATHFFAGAARPSDRVMHLGIGTSGALSWDDLPRHRVFDGADGNPKRALGRMVRFAFAYDRAYRPFLTRAGQQRVKRQAWFKRLIRGSGVDLNDDEVQATLGNLEDYCKRFLRWIATLSTVPAGSPIRPRLIDPGAFATDELSEGATVVLRTAYGPMEKERFRALVAEDDELALADVFHGLTYDPVLDRSAGLGRFVQLLHEQCARRAAGGDT